MTVLRLERRSPGQVARALAAIDEVVLARTPDGRFAEVSPQQTEPLIRALALVGVEASPCEIRLDPGEGLRPAIGRHLGPLNADPPALDVVHLRRLSLSDSTREAMRRPWAGLRPPSPAARERCRALLRGTEIVLAWTRRAWGTAAYLRTPAARAALRPIVFDRDATTHAPECRTLASDGQLERWLF